MFGQQPQDDQDRDHERPSLDRRIIMAIFWALFSLLVGYLFDLYNGDASLPNNNSPRINPTVVELADEFQEMQTRTAELEAFNNMIPTPRR